MKQSSRYGERDYAFAQLMLTLRTTLGLTQGDLAERLGVSLRPVPGWEAGSVYPKAERLKAFIELCVRASAFPAGREEEQIRALWRAAHLDEDWLRALLRPRVPALTGVAPPAVGQTREGERARPASVSTCSGSGSPWGAN